MSPVDELIAEVLRRWGYYVQSGRLHEARSYSMSADSVGKLVGMAIAAQQELVEGQNAISAPVQPETDRVASMGLILAPEGSGLSVKRAGHAVLVNAPEIVAWRLGARDFSDQPACEDFSGVGGDKPACLKAVADSWREKE